MQRKSWVRRSDPGRKEMVAKIQAITWLSPGQVDLQVMGVYQARPT